MEELTVEEIEEQLQTDQHTGLSSQVAAERLKQNGLNQLPKTKNRPWYLILLFSLLEPLSIILILAGVISVVVEKIVVNDPSITEFIVIVIIVFINATIQTVQQVKSQNSVAALEKMTVNKIAVKRDNKIVEIPTTELVVGDVVLLEAGKYIPADLRLVETNRFLVDESSLTGESVPVEKHSKKITESNLILAEKKNIAFMSTFVTNGRAIGIVTASAKQSEIGKIAHDITNASKSKTPLQMRLSKFTKWISLLAIVVAVLIFIFFYFTSSANWATYFLTSVTIAIAIIPESLIVIVSIILVFSLNQMAKVNVLVKKLDAVETLGAVNIICSDKTGTLTQNKMTIKKVFYNQSSVAAEKFVFNKEKMLHFINALTLCNDAVNENNERIGDPTEIALIDFTRTTTLGEVSWRKKYRRIEELPFDSERKLMTTVNEVNKNEYVYVKGSIDNLLVHCSEIMINDKIIKLTSKMKEEILATIGIWSNDALRVIAVACKKNNNGNLESQLTFLGAVGMIDPVRPEAISSIATAHNAGIRVIMITGDHMATALAISKQLNIAQTTKEVLSGTEVDKFSDEQLTKALEYVNVFARVNPSHKTRIVNCLKKLDYIVSMTGDGVNDAPSLSNADIGIAMGITGTDVAKQAADIILQDDNFSTIINGVEEGRNVYYKIKKAITFIMAANLANVLTFVVVVLATGIKPFDAINILWYNLIIETVLAIPIGLDGNDARLMYKKSRDKHESLFHNSIITILFLSFIVGICAISIFFIGTYGFHDQTYGKVGTIFFLDCAPCLYIWQIELPDFNLETHNIIKKDQKWKSFWLAILHILHLKSSKDHILEVNRVDKRFNWYMLAAALIAFLLTMAIIFIPDVNEIFLIDIITSGEKFNYEFISWQVLLISIAMLFVPVILFAMYKKFRWIIKK